MHPEPTSQHALAAGLQDGDAAAGPKEFARRGEGTHAVAGGGDTSPTRKKVDRLRDLKTVAGDADGSQGGYPASIGGATQVVERFRELASSA